MDRLALFDVDNTLVKTPQSHVKVFSIAFKKVYGVDASLEMINYHGNTDQKSIFEVLEKVGLTEQQIKPKLKECMKAMSESFEELLPREDIVVFEGVRETLEILVEKNVMLGLVTGGLEPIARSKLKKVDLEHFFRVGAFGSDDISRDNLVKLAVRRAEKLGFSSNNNAYIFGDSPRDIESGKHASLITIGVASGTYSVGQLNEAGADFVLDNLEDAHKVLGIMDVH